MYADVKKEFERLQFKNLKGFSNLLENYADFKRGFVTDIEYPLPLEGIFR